MTETYDVTIAGAGYMVKPGAYARFQDGQSEGRVGRVRVFDFYGGGRRAVQLERDKFWRGLGIFPALDSQGITAGPKRQDTTENEAPAIDPEAERWSFAYNGTTYVVQGSRLYRVTTSSGLYAGLDAVQALTATVVDCTLLGSKLYFAHGTANQISTYDLSSSTYTTDALGTTSAHNARLIGQDRGNIQYVQPTDAHSYRNTSATPFNLDGYIRRLVEHDGRLWAFTDKTLWKIGSEDSAEATLPRLGYADDVAWAVSHQGQLWTWIGHEVMRYTKPKDLQSAQAVFTTTGLRGLATLGACSVGIWLVVAIVSEITGMVELWATDGRGWWLVDEQTTTETKWSYPVSAFGSADDCDLLAGRGTVDQQTAIWQFLPRTGSPGLSSSAELITALLDAGQRDLVKVWRRAGVEIAMPDERATADEVTVTLAYSVDGGANWVHVATDTLSDADGRLVTIAGLITALPQARFLQLKLRMTSISDWCPVVVGLWAEHETMDSPSRRRRWRFTVQCKDAVIRRDGAVDATGARQLAINLWDAWDDGGIVSFKDVDYDLTSDTYSVRIAGIRELVNKVQEAATFADSELELTLVEV